MKRLIRKILPNYVTRADLTIVESDIGGDIKLLQGRIALLESCMALSADAVEIAAARIYAAEKRIEELEGEIGQKVSVFAFENLPLADGRATRTEIVEIKQPKGRGPKGAK